MCNPTKQPPRRDMYELEESMRTSDGPFFVPKPRAPRLTVRVWTSGRVGIYNANYASNGDKFLDLFRPWTVVTPSDFQTFTTHAEALACATKETE